MVKIKSTTIGSAAMTAPPMPVTLIYPHRRHLPQRVRVVMDWLAQGGQDHTGRHETL